MMVQRRTVTQSTSIDAHMKYKTQGSKATENASAKHKTRGSKATENANAKPEGAKRPSRRARMSAANVGVR